MYTLRNVHSTNVCKVLRSGRLRMAGKLVEPGCMLAAGRELDCALLSLIGKPAFIHTNIQCTCMHGTNILHDTTQYSDTLY